MAEQLITVPIDQIYPNPYQPRLEFAQEELEGLGQSIKENGLIQPLIVRQSDVWGYELIAGERRLRACKLIGLETVPVLVKDISDQTSMKQAIIENLQRADLNPIEEALAYQKLIEKTGMTHDDIAQTMGKSRPYITNSLRLLNLPQEGQEALIDGQMSAGHARLLLSLDQTDQQIAWVNRICQNGLTVRQLEAALKNKKSPKKEQQNKLFIKNQEEVLKQELGRPVTIISKANQSGQLILPFDSLEDFHNLLHTLQIHVDSSERDY